jgi:GTP-binding protein HflX
MNLLTKADVFAENKLFATVDSTVRKVVLDSIPFLLTDTVGFIRKLPTTLIESFKSTLSEIVEADVLLHVVDISHPSFEDHLAVVEKTLAEIGAADKTVVLVFNKIDAYQHPEEATFSDAEFGVLDADDPLDYEPEELDEAEGGVATLALAPPALATRPKPGERATLDQLKAMYLGKKPRAVFISAAQRENIQELREMILQEVAKKYFSVYPNFLQRERLPAYIKFETSV